MRLSLKFFCCASLIAVAYAGVIYQKGPSEAASVLANQDGDLPRLSTLDLDLQHPLISQFRAIGDRPLFTRSRRPTLDPATEQVQVYRLRGVLTVNSQEVALVERVDDGTLLRVFEGDMVDVWRVSEIGRDSISWSRLDGFHEMIVSEIWEQEEASTFPDAPQEDRSGVNGSNQRSASSHFNKPRRHTAGERALSERHLTDAGGYTTFVVPTEPPPPTPTAPRVPPVRRIRNPNGPS